MSRIGGQAKCADTNEVERMTKELGREEQTKYVIDMKEVRDLAS